MRHKMAGRKFSRTSSHRQAMFANLAMNLIEHGQIKTTLPKAKDLRRVVEPLITKAKKGDLAARREVLKTITNEAIVKKLFDEVAPMFKERNGGYTRVLKAGHRLGDAADMAIIELVAKPEEAKAEEKKPAAKKPAAKKAAPKKAEETKEAKPAAKKAPAKKAAPKKAAAKKAEEKAE